MQPVHASYGSASSFGIEIAVEELLNDLAGVFCAAISHRRASELLTVDQLTMLLVNRVQLLSLASTNHFGYSSYMHEHDEPRPAMS